VPLVISGSDAAGNGVTDTKTVNVDNSVPTLSLSGPTDAPSTAGTQFVTATAGGSPSGIDQIVCSVDGGPAQPYPGASADVPVSGLGQHQVRCTALDNAVDANGVRGASQTQTASIKIGAPTALDLTFARFARRRCSKLAARRATCELKAKTTQHVGHGHATTVSGWLGLADGTALAGETVDVVTAPDNGLGKFTRAVRAITAANGTWTATLPPGPSRLVKAYYPGTATTERSTSRQVKLLVKSKVTLESVIPNRVAWGQTVTIKGRLLGGYLPRAGINVRLRVGIANANITFGVKEHVSGSGKFTATFTFGPDSPQIHRNYWFQVASLPAGDYPYTPSASNRMYVQVG
jgi:hypothetical protein